MQCLPYQELVELAYQLKIDVQKREKEIIELDVKVENLERDKEEKVSQLAAIAYQLNIATQTCTYLASQLQLLCVKLDVYIQEQECNVLKEQLTETVKENENLKKQIIQVCANCVNYCNLFLQLCVWDISLCSPVAVIKRFHQLASQII